MAEGSDVNYWTLVTSSARSILLLGVMIWAFTRNRRARSIPK
jgi:hypothetical protein